MKLTIKALFLVIIVSKSFGQIPFSSTPKFGNFIKVNPQENKPVFVGSSGNQIFGISKNYFSTSLYTFNKESLEIEGKPSKLKLSYQDNKLGLEEVITFGDQLLFITSYRNKEKDIKYFFIQKYLGNGSVSDPSLIAEINWEKAKGLFAVNTAKFEQMNSFKIDISPNGEFIAFVSPGNINKELDSTGKWNAIVLDQKLETKWKQSINLLSNELSVNVAKVNNEGVVFLASAKNDTKKNYAFSNGNSYYKTLNYDYYNVNLLNFLVGSEHYLEIVDGSNHIQKPLNLDGTKFITMAMDVLESELVFYGITEVEEKLDYQVHFSLYDFTGNEISNNYQDLNPEMFQNSKIRKGLFNKKSKEKEVVNYFLKDVYKAENGNFVFLAEEFHHYVTRQRMSNSTIEYEHYVYGNLISFCFDREANFKWSNTYNKYIKTTNDFGYFGSYYSMMHNNDLYVLTNASERGVLEDEIDSGEVDVKETSKRKVIVALVRIDENGNMTDNILINSETKGKNDICLRYGLLFPDSFIGIAHFYKGAFSVRPRMISIPYNE